MAVTKLHADDTPVPVLTLGNRKTKTGRRPATRSGGPPGYDAFLNTLTNDPNSEEAEHYQNWVGPGSDVS